MMPVQVAKFVPSDRAEPEEEWGVRLHHIGTEVLPRLEANILDDIGWVNPTLEPRVQAKAHHPAQPRSVPLHQLRPAQRVAGGGLFQQVRDIARVRRHGDYHNSLIVTRGGLVTALCDFAIIGFSTAMPGSATRLVRFTQPTRPSTNRI
jgi:hypothetical protein